MKKILIIGGTGMLGQPVVKEFSNSGFEVSVMTRNIEKAQSIFNDQVQLKQGDLKDRESVVKAMAGHEGLYLNLATDPSETESDFHPELDGLRIILDVARDNEIKRIGMISSLVQYYEGFYWWVFYIKKEAVKLMRETKIPYFIFYPSTFMESIPYKYRQGSKLYMIGESKVKLFWIAGQDYGRQVARAFELNPSSSREYVVQGREAMTIDQALEVFKNHYKKEKLKISKVPVGLLKFISLFSKTARYGVKISEALNNHPEKLAADDTWKELGEPVITLQQYADSL